LLLNKLLPKRAKSWLIVLISTTLVIVGVLYYFNYEYIPNIEASDLPMVDSLKTEKQIIRMYGLPVDSFNVLSQVVRRDETLLTILSKYTLPEGSFQKLLTIQNPAFDLRKIKAGNKYFVFLQRDSLSALRYFVYEHTPLEFIIFSFSDSVTVEVGQKDPIQKRQFATGTINTSLWNAMIERGYNPMLANELSEIYAWSIDFFGLQPADSFSVVYDELFVDSISIGLGRIHAAYFTNSGAEFYAIPFEQDSVESYFDVQGNSLRKAFLKAPLRFSRISSRFSNSRMHPVLKIRRPHHGVDYAAPSGTPVQAIGDGRIVEAKRGYNNGGGNMIKIKHNSVYSTAYLHLSGFAPGIAQGIYVKQGDVIGYVGTTGLSSGPHLDFRFYQNGNAIDPLKVEAPPVEPVHQENLAAFDSVKTKTINLLHASAKLDLLRSSH
jgi:murein DD-endopeptidase MepM/ murein hydrolase activator NlpD